MYCMAEVSMLTRTAEMHRDKIIKYTLAYHGPPMCKVRSAPKAGFASLQDLKLLKNVKNTQPVHELKVKIT